MMGPEVVMNGKVDTIMEELPVCVNENGSSVKLPEEKMVVCGTPEVSLVCEKENGSTVKLPVEKMVVCATNCEDHAFVDPVDKISEDDLVITGIDTTLDLSPKAEEGVDDLVMTCASSYEDSTFHMEVPAVDCDQVMASKGNNEDVEVEIVENVNSDEEMVAERESLDATENSSSFGCTDSGAGTAGASSDVEVESQVRDDNGSLMEFDGFSDLFQTRKKKLSAHWRKFIRPLMWRCKWAELHIRELRSQISKYEHELEDCARRKQCVLEKYASEDLAVKSVPFVCQDRTVRVMKRKKRKRVEETSDVAAYSSCHNLFSYIASKRPSGDLAYLDDDHGNNEKTTSCVFEFGIDGDLSFLEFKDGDAFENILQNIEVAQSKVRQLRLKIDKVVKENGAKFTSGNSSIVPGEPAANCGPSSYLHHVNGENSALKSLPTTSQQTSQKKIVSDKIEHEILLYNQPVKEELNNTEVVGDRHTIEFMSGVEVKLENAEHAPDPNSPSKMTVTREQMTAKIRSKLITTPKNKKKRGRRKARAGRWSRKSSG